MPLLILVSSKVPNSLQPWSFRVLCWNKSIQRLLCVSRILNLMELGTKLQPRHTPCRRKGNHRSSTSGQDGVRETKLSHVMSLFREEGFPPHSSARGLRQSCNVLLSVQDIKWRFWAYTVLRNYATV